MIEREVNKIKRSKVTFYITIALFVIIFVSFSIINKIQEDKRDILYIYTDKKIDLKENINYEQLFGINEANKRFKFIILNGIDKRFSIQRYPTFIIVDWKFKDVKFMTNQNKGINDYK